MTKLYKSQVSDSWMHRDGIGWYTQAGSPQTVDGTPMVAVARALVPADGWHASERDAHLEAAHRIEEIGRTLIAQAEAIRQGGAT